MKTQTKKNKEWYLFRKTVSYSEVTCITSFNSYLVVFRKNKICEFIDTELNSVIKRYFIGKEVLQSYQQNDKLVCRTVNNSVFNLSFDLNSISCVIIDEYKDEHNEVILVTLISHYNSNSSIKINYFVNNKNIIRFDNNEVVYRSLEVINFIKITEDCIFIGTELNSLKVFTSNLEIISECVLDGKITSINCYNKGVIISLENGMLLNYDYLNDIVLNSTTVRNTSIICLISNEFIYCSGKDSRIIVYSLNDLSKISQTTVHTSEVNSLYNLNGNIYTGGLDSFIAKNIFINQSFKHLKIYESSCFTGTFDLNNEEYFYILNGDNLCVYKYDGETINIQNDIVHEDGIVENNTKIDWDKPVEKLICQKSLSEDFINDVLFYKEYFIYTNKKQTIVYKIDNNFDFDILTIIDENIISMNIKENNFFYLTNKCLKMMDLKTLEKLEYSLEINTPFIDYKILINNSFIFINGINYLLKLENNLFKEIIDFPNKINDCLMIGDSIIILYDNKIERIFLETKERNVKNIDLPVKYLYNDIYGYDTKFVCNLENNKMYRLEPVIHGIYNYKNSFIIIQSFWEDVKRCCFEPGIFREKYSNK
ncbi:hypothetical protein HERIO_86 [Hepatospora eriocheir]|uniref:Uncharacterized protein n=1 Tax=Hepatospora eriocheir TaxID=1081669 RepID=A0A1X0QE99_9MICR|nr:hypothetical protein HERIO_86 [Hepatospora eriocheir]